MPLSESDLAMRPTHACASEMAQILGVHPKHGPLVPFWRKIGEPLDQIIDCEPIYWGNAMEPLLAARYCKEHNLLPSQVLPSPTVESRKYPWMACTPDGLVYDTSMLAPDWGAEYKTACHAEQVRRFGKAGDEVPEEYLVQCHTCMIVMELDRWDMAVLLGTWHGFEYREYTLHADVDLDNQIIEISHSFIYDHVLKRIDPPAHGWVSDAAVLRKRYPEDTTPMMPADTDTTDLAIQYAAALKALAVDEKEKRLIQQQLMARIKTAQGVEGRDWGIKWKSGKSGRRFSVWGKMFDKKEKG